jgi:hypothetical protein
MDACMMPISAPISAPISFCVIIAGVIVVIWTVGQNTDSTGGAQRDRRPGAKALATEATKRATCISTTIPKARGLADELKFQTAVDLLDDCINTAFDPQIRQARDAIQARWQLDWLKNNPKAPWENRLTALREVNELAPELLGSYAAEFKTSSQRYERESAQLRKKADADHRAQRRKEGVTIGLPQEDVLMSSWGKPEAVNKTVTSRCTREQWVYGSGNYLYFEGDVLKSFQTRNER